jgi:hypothetical protein
MDRRANIAFHDIVKFIARVTAGFETECRVQGILVDKFARLLNAVEIRIEGETRETIDVGHGGVNTLVEKKDNRYQTASRHTGLLFIR